VERWLQLITAIHSAENEEYILCDGTSRITVEHHDVYTESTRFNTMSEPNTRYRAYLDM